MTQIGFALPAPGHAPSSPRSLSLRPVGWRTAAEWLAHRHYLGPCESVCRLARLRLGVYADGVLRGALVFAHPVAPAEDQLGTLELARMHLADELPRNSESRCLALAARYIRRYCPGVQRLIAYSDEAVGHRGTVYAAAGWRCVGVVPPQTWARTQRPGRTRRTGRKRKWEVMVGA